MAANIEFGDAEGLDLCYQAAVQAATDDVEASVLCE